MLAVIIIEKKAKLRSSVQEHTNKVEKTEVSLTEIILKSRFSYRFLLVSLKLEFWDSVAGDIQ